MYCPNCGKVTETDQKFCRSCGLGLEKIAHSLTEQLPTRVDDSLIARKERLEKMGLAALCIFGLGILGFLGYGVVYKMMLAQGSIVGGLMILGMLLIVVCGLASTVLFAQAKELEEKGTKRRLQPRSETIKEQDTKELLEEGHLESVPSVTERTTELLAVENKKTQRDIR